MILFLSQLVLVLKLQSMRDEAHLTVLALPEKKQIKWLSATNFQNNISQIKYFDFESSPVANLLRVLTFIQTALWHSCRYVKRATRPWKN